MLLSFSVKNFGPFQDKVTLSMFPANLKKQHPEHIISTPSFKALKGGCIFGANASGKTRAISILPTLRNMIFIRNSPSLLLSNQYMFGDDRISEFEVDYQIDSVDYRYYVSTDGNVILKESLSLIQKNGNLKPIFERNNLDITIGKMLSDSENWYKGRTLKSSSFYLKQLETDGIIDNRNKIVGSEHFIRAYNFFMGMSGIDPVNGNNIELLYGDFTVYGYHNFLEEFLKHADLGISNVNFEPLSKDKVEELWKDIIKFYEVSILTSFKAIWIKDPASGNFYILEIKNNELSGYKIVTYHNNKRFDMLQESSGTIRMIEISIYFYKLITSDNMCLFIDELDCRLHPFLAEFLLKLHLGNNKHNSQLLVTLHEFYLMNSNIWRSDEIWLTEKRINGSSDLYSLYQFRPRFDKDLQNGYMQGRYGAIPMLGDFNE